MHANDLYATVTSSIVSDLEAGDLPPWRKPWAGGNATLPLRHSGVSYRGVNILILWIEAIAKGFCSPYWLTFNQAKEYGGSVRKGEKSTAILWCEPITKKDTAEDGSEGESRFWISRVYRVFNAQQCDGLPEKYTAKVEPILDPAQRIEHAETFVKNTAADIRQGWGGAYYQPTEDFISLPPFEQFESPEAYYSTALHELSHWTGHSSRLNRDLKGFGQGKQEYSREEIVAELSAVMLSAQLGLPLADLKSHASYLEFWLKAMKEDPKYLFTAASKAQAAADYLQGLQPQP